MTDHDQLPALPERTVIEHAPVSMGRLMPPLEATWEGYTADQMYAFRAEGVALERARADALQAELTEVKGFYQRAGEHYAELEARADALEAALRRWLPATRPNLFNAAEFDQWCADHALLENKHGST